MRSRSLPLLALLASVSPAAIALAEEVTFLDTITVLGTRTAMSVRDNPRSVSVIDQSTIERRAPESIAELLRDVPGARSCSGR